MHKHVWDSSSKDAGSKKVPVSNAIIKRIFSIVSTTKTKERSPMQSQLIKVILKVGSQLYFKEKCCVNVTHRA